MLRNSHSHTPWVSTLIVHSPFCECCLAIIPHTSHTTKQQVVHRFAVLFYRDRKIMSIDQQTDFSTEHHFLTLSFTGKWGTRIKIGCPMTQCSTIFHFKIGGEDDCQAHHRQRPHKYRRTALFHFWCPIPISETIFLDGHFSEIKAQINTN